MLCLTQAICCIGEVLMGGIRGTAAKSFDRVERWLMPCPYRSWVW
ncbi:hypothetical protein [Microseira wollei]|nr:hypothetical protein [Microseira wollei]